MGGDGNLAIGPGFAGFVAFFLMAVALWLLVRNMSGRLRRMAYQEREREMRGTDRDTALGTASVGSDDRPGDEGGATATTITTDSDGAAGSSGPDGEPGARP